MATLTGTELVELRNGCEASVRTAGVAIAYTKAQINAAVQAVEDYTETTARAGYGAAIEVAAPGVFNAAAKKRIVARYFQQKFRREGV